MRDFNPVPKPLKSDRIKAQAERREKRRVEKLAEKRAKLTESRKGMLGRKTISYQPAALPAAERRHLRRVKELPCVCCGKFGPSDAHHTMSDRHGRPKPDGYACIPLCKTCHQNGKEAFHNDKALWEKTWGKDWSYIPVVLEKLGISTNFDFT